MQLDILPRPAMVVNGALEVLDCNRAVLKALRIASTEAPQDRQRLAQALAAEQADLGDDLALATARLSPGEEERFAWSSGEHSFEVSISLRQDRDDEFFVMLSDRTNEVLTEEIQVNARHYLEQILGQIPVGVLVLDRRLRITSANRQMLAYCGRLGGVADLVSVIGSSLREVLPQTPGGRWQTLCEEVIGDNVVGAASDGERACFNTADGDLVLSTEVTSLRDQRGGLTGAILMSTDITERARLEREVVRMEKLATVGQMVVTINHEINNPLLIISTNAQAMRLMNRDLDEKTTKKLQKIEEQVKRISAVTERLRTMDEVASEDYIAEGPQMINVWGDDRQGRDDDRQGRDDDRQKPR